MSERFVIDASIGLAWVHPSQATSQTAALLRQVELGAELVVPALWFSEVANALLVLERRKKLSADEREKALSRLASLGASIDEEGPRLAFTATSKLAFEHGLSVYDACYLELAARRKLALASRDDTLRAAAKRSGVKLL